MLLECNLVLGSFCIKEDQRTLLSHYIKHFWTERNTFKISEYVCDILKIAV